MATSYTNLEPAFTGALSSKPLSFDATQAVSTFATFDFLYVSSITLIIGAAAVMYIIAGGWRIEASERGMRKSNETFKRVTLGLIGVLSMFTVIYTINRDLLRGDVGLSRLSSITRGAGTAGVVPVTQPIQTNGTEQANWNALTSAGIRIVSTSGQTTPCTKEQLQQSNPACVSLVDIPQSVITMLIELKDLCPGNMQVTGGTEPGHKTHGPNKAAVDVDNNDSSINSCVRNFPKGPNVGAWCTVTFMRSGFIFCDEKGTSHWHIFN